MKYSNQSKKILFTLLLFWLTFLYEVPLLLAQAGEFSSPTTSPAEISPPAAQNDLPPPTPQPEVVPAPESTAVNEPFNVSQKNSSFVQDGVTMLGRFLGMEATDPRLIAASLIRIALGFLGIIFLVMILLAGFTLMTSGGNSERIGAAKRTFFNAIIGLIIILSANSIVMYVIRAFSNAPDTSQQSGVTSIQPDDL